VSNEAWERSNEPAALFLFYLSPWAIGVFLGAIPFET